jgi:hypothetical protein
MLAGYLPRKSRLENRPLPYIAEQPEKISKKVFWNLQLLNPDANGKFTGDASKAFLDLSTDPSAPRELVAVVAKSR